MENEEEAIQASKRVPLTQIDQVNSDFAMALTLQERERVFSVLETIESDDDDDSEAFYNQSYNNDYDFFECLEAVGDLEFLEGLYRNNVDEDTEDDNNEEEEEEYEIDVDNLSYEELIALGEIIGVENRGLSEKEICSCLVSFKFQSIECKNGIDRCVICQVEYEDDEGLVALPNCEHPYHLNCISRWLRMKKICPICSIEISSSSSKHDTISPAATPARPLHTTILG